MERIGPDVRVFGSAGWRSQSRRLFPMLDSTRPDYIAKSDRVRVFGIAAKMICATSSGASEDVKAIHGCLSGERFQDLI